MSNVLTGEINIDLSRDQDLDDFTHVTIRERYLVGDETSPQHAFARASAAFADDKEHAQRLYDYVSRLWFMYATPVLANGGTSRGLPISCFLNYVPDSREGILGHYVENGWLSSMGGGIGTYWGALRSLGESTTRGAKTSGVIPFMKVVDSQILAFQQGGTRRGSAAVYLDISHPEIIEFMNIRKPTGGDDKRKCLYLHHGVNIPDSFMEAVARNDEWELIDPNSGTVKKTLSARGLWRDLLNVRRQTGEPFLHFIDATNRALPEAQKKLGLKVHQSNLCTEITLPTGPDHLGNMRTAVCCLSSLNLATYDEWKDDERFVEDVMRMLDNVLTYFIAKAPPEMKDAVYSAHRERAIGMGTLGWHTYLQKHMIPFESVKARAINAMIYSDVAKRADVADHKLGAERGSPPDMEGTGRRFSHTTAIAPNASSSILCGGVSPSAEPIPANIFNHKTLSGSFAVKNKQLQRLLASKGSDLPSVWTSITAAEGSVQHLDCLSDLEKDVFKTAMEIDQMSIIRMAADRTPLITQAQSVNIFIPRGVSAEDLNRYHFEAWASGMKTLYYCRAQTDKRAGIQSAKAERRVVEVGAQSECLSCEG